MTIQPSFSLKSTLWLNLVLLFNFATRQESSALEVAGVFGDRAVLQQGVLVPIWGTASSGATVVVEFAGQSEKA